MFVWLSAYPSKCRGDLFCALPLSVEVILVERGVVYFQLYLPQILSGGFLCGKFCVDELVKILLCEMCARTSKHILVFAFDPLSLTLSLTFVHYIILSYHIHACVVCVCPYLCLTKSCLLYTSPSPRDRQKSRMPSSA